MALTKLSRANFILYSKEYILSAQQDPYISQQILNVGYDENRLNEGLAQQQTTHDSRQNQMDAKKKAKSLGTVLKKDFKKKMRAFVDDSRLLRSIFIRKIEIKERIGLYGITKRNVPGFVLQARNRYNAILAEPDILSKLAPFNFTEVTIQERLTGIDELEQAHLTFIDADKEVEDATDEFEKEYGKLIDWIRAFQDACRIVLKDKPQLLEKVGVVVRSAPLPRKKATDNPDSQDTQVQDETPDTNPDST
jgi:hypothetical protein